VGTLSHDSERVDLRVEVELRVEVDLICLSGVSTG
jgi:hypothetical protein